MNTTRRRRLAALLLAGTMVVLPAVPAVADELATPEPQATTTPAPDPTPEPTAPAPEPEPTTPPAPEPTPDPAPEPSPDDAQPVTSSDPAGAPAEAEAPFAAAASSSIVRDDAYVVQENVPVFSVYAPGLLVNDSVADEDYIRAASAADHGFAQVNSDGSVLYYPPEDFVGIDTFKYVATGPNGTSAPATVTMTVVPAIPVGVPDQYDVATGESLTVDAPGVLDNDTNDTSSADLVTGPAHGELQWFGDGGFTYTPEAGFAGTDSFTYRAVGPAGTAEQATTVTLDVSLQPRFTQTEFYGYAGDQIDFSDALDLGAPGATFLGYDVENDLGYGHLEPPALFDPDDTPSGSFTWGASLVVTYRDTVYRSPVTQLTFHTLPRPDLIDDGYFVTAGEELTVPAPGLLGNDAIDGDVDGIEVTQPDAGSVTVAKDGSFTFTAPADTGVDSTQTFRYRIVQHGAASQWADVTVDVATGVVLREDAYTATDGVLDVPAPGPLANDTLPGGQLWTLSSCTSPEDVTIVCDPDGHVHVEAPDDWSGTVTVTYEVAAGGAPRLPRPVALMPAATRPTGTMVVTVPARTGGGGSGDDDTGRGGDRRDDPDPSATLPDTGAPAEPWWLAVAAAMVTAGAWIVRRGGQATRS